MGTIKSILLDKKLLLLLMLFILLGIFVRLYKASEIGYWSDDETTLPTGLLWFYDHNFYPGLLGQGEPAFGNYIFGKACMLSGQDFSGVMQMQPRFYPGREILIGEQLIRANSQCHAPMYIFGILFFILSIIFASMLLKKHGTIMVAGLIAFNSFLLVFSRWIHVDIILYTFVVFGLISLFKALKAEKGSKSEKIWWISTVAMMAFAFSIKLPAAMYIIFSGLVMAIKYKDEIKGLLYKISKELGLGIVKQPENMPDPKTFFLLAIIAIAAYLAILFLTFEKNFSNIPTVINAYRAQGADIGTLGLNKEILSDIKKFLLTFSNLEMLIIIASILYLPFVLKKTINGTLEEKFTAYLVALLLFMLATSPSMKLERIFFLFSFGLVLSTGMLVDKIAEKYARFGKASYIVAIALIFSIPLYNAIYTAPDFISNYKLYNIMSNPSSSTALQYGARPIGEYLQALLGENETYFPAEPMTMVTYYVRHEQQLQYYLFRENFKAKFGKSPTVSEYLQYFKPSNRRIRYLLIDKNTQSTDEFIRDILENYEPMHIVYQPSIRKVETIRVYDLDNLKKK